MNRIEQALAALKEKNEKAFITYITAGLPNYDKTKEIIKAQEKAEVRSHRSPGNRAISDTLKWRVADGTVARRAVGAQADIRTAKEGRA